MAVKYLNNVGETGCTYSSDGESSSVSLSGTALTGMQTFADAESNGKIAASGDDVGVKVTAESNRLKWVVLVAGYTGGSTDTLNLNVTIEDTAPAGAPSNGDSVEVIAVATAGQFASYSAVGG